MPHPFSPSGDPKKRKRQYGHVASYYTAKGQPEKAAKFRGGGAVSKEAVGRRLKKKKKKK